MNTLKLLVMLGVIAATLVVFAAGASATTLEVGGVTQNKAVLLKASLERETSVIVKDEAGTTTDTCTGATFEGATTTFTGVSVTAPLSSMSFSNCSHTKDVLTPGSLSIAWIKGTTNGTVTSSGAEVLLRSTFFGTNATCRTGGGTDIGTLTGKASGSATIDLNALINCGILGNANWTGSYLITSPEGLGVVE